MAHNLGNRIRNNRTGPDVDEFDLRNALVFLPIGTRDNECDLLSVRRNCRVRDVDYLPEIFEPERFVGGLSDRGGGYQGERRGQEETADWFHGSIPLNEFV